MYTCNNLHGPSTEPTLTALVATFVTEAIPLAVLFIVAAPLLVADGRDIHTLDCQRTCDYRASVMMSEPPWVPPSVPYWCLRRLGRRFDRRRTSKCTIDQAIFAEAVEKS